MAEALPKALVDPPWSRAPEAPKDDAQILVPGLVPPDDRHIAWLPGEREEWAASQYGKWHGDEWEAAVEQFRDGRMHYPPTQATLLALGPEHLVRPLLADWAPTVTWDFAHSLRPIIGRFEGDARDVAVRLGRSNPHGTGPALLPFLDAEVARLMADWLYRLKSAQPLAREWFGRHGLAAVPYLVPDALGKRRAARRTAVHALRWIHEEVGGDVAEAARVHGDEAAKAVAELLATAPRYVPAHQQAAKPPVLPAWVEPGALPPPVLRGGRELPADAVRTFVLLLAMAERPDAYPGVEDAVAEAAAACEPASLTAFAWGMFEAWRTAGMPGRSGFVLPALGRFGDAETVRRLTPLIREWPGQSGHDRAVAGLDALVAIGERSGDMALIELSRIARKVKYKGLQRQAEIRLQRLAADRGLTADELADRLVPDFGLDAAGTMTLDYGPRRFTVGFDEQLKPYVTGDDGKRRKALPKPGAKDDPDLAPAAYARFAALKKDVRAIAGDQAARLESAMVAGRRWTPADFRAFFVDHPLIWHVAKRLVWTTGAAASDTAAFRLAEDRTPTDVNERPFTIPDAAHVGIAHPLHLGEEVAAWSELFADYEILQPFPQLGRPVLTLDEGEGEDGRLARFEGLSVPYGKILGLTRAGWVRGTPQDGGIEEWISKQVAPDRHVVIDLNPGIAVGYVNMTSTQTLTRVRMAPAPHSADPPIPHGFADLDPVVLSELLLDLESLL
ncbi:DUF4132 domain-containing protein [Actinomadura fibrosa]|uniref:DUF4132 domain-containing protein n=1 Tax=Actinomadura fibrosa TaxID=111802 RepID=A0ABW2XA98_9ACTN|nr:DUF4132 domain-containing protein [Actinomadura fibrosa]